jgi:hypothetical protein
MRHLSAGAGLADPRVGPRRRLLVDHAHAGRAVAGGAGVAGAGVAASRGWRALRFAGPLPLDQTGILASVTTPLAAAHISVFVIGTYDTDYVLIPEAQQRDAFLALEQAGHSVTAL